MKYIGKTYPIHDARAKVTGETVYAGDMTLPRMAYVKLLLSPVAHAEIKSIDTSEAEKVPGVVGVFTHRDASGMRFSSARMVPDEEGCVEDEPLFARTVRYVGDRVAAVVATHADIARAAVERIRVDYEPLPVVAGIKEIHRRAGFDGPTEAEVISDYEFDITSEALDPQGLDSLPEVETCVHTPKTHHAARRLMSAWHPATVRGS